MKIKIEELKDLMRSILTSKYYSDEEANKMIEVLLFAELSGKNTQGVLKLLGSNSAQDIKPKYRPKLVKKTELSAIVDGGGSAGMLPAQIAVDKVIEIAGKNNFGIAGLNNTFSSVGAIGFYARKMAINNLIGIVMANSPRAVAQFGSIEPTFGTNPSAFAFPTKTFPITFDFAAAAITWYGLVRAKMLGQKIPEKLAIDKDGNLTTDPEAAMKGAILPFDKSYKGSGLAMVVELLAGVLTGSDFVFDEGNWGTIFIAISPNLLIGVDEFKNGSSALVQKIKSQKTKSGGSIHVPGFDTEKEMEKIIKSGEIDIEEKILDQLRNIVK